MANKNERRLTIGSLSDSVKVAELIDTVHGMARELIAKDEIISNQQVLLAQRDERVQDLVSMVKDLEARLQAALLDGSDHDNVTAPNDARPVYIMDGRTLTDCSDDGAVWEQDEPYVIGAAIEFCEYNEKDGYIIQDANSNVLAEKPAPNDYCATCYHSFDDTCDNHPTCQETGKYVITPNGVYAVHVPPFNDGTEPIPDDILNTLATDDASDYEQFIEKTGTWNTETADDCVHFVGLNASDVPPKTFCGQQAWMQNFSTSQSLNKCPDCEKVLNNTYASRNDKVTALPSRVHVLRGKRGYSSGSYEVVGQIGEYIRYRNALGNVATVLATKTKAA